MKDITHKPARKWCEHWMIYASIGISGLFTNSISVLRVPKNLTLTTQACIEEDCTCSKRPPKSLQRHFSDNQGEKTHKSLISRTGKQGMARIAKPHR